MIATPTDALDVLYRKGRLHRTQLDTEVVRYLQPLIDSGVLRSRDTEIEVVRLSIIAALANTARERPALPPDVIVCRIHGPWKMSWPDSQDIDLATMTAVAGAAAIAIGPERWPRWPGPCRIVTDAGRFLSDRYPGEAGLILLLPGPPSDTILAWLDSALTAGEPVTFDGPVDDDRHRALAGFLGRRLVLATENTAIATC